MSLEDEIWSGTGAPSFEDGLQAGEDWGTGVDSGSVEVEDDFFELRDDESHEPHEAPESEGAFTTEDPEHHELAEQAIDTGLAEKDLMAEGTAPVPEWPVSSLPDVHSTVIAGAPDIDGKIHVRQEEASSCAIAAQRGILESIFGHEIPESELRDRAVTEGWHDAEHGTAGEDVGKLLEAYGVPVERSFDRKLTDLYDALQRNEKVLVGLDGNEVWNPVRGPGGAPLELTNDAHIVWVTGMKFDDAGNVSVVLNDSGLPAGQSMTVDAADFLNAWADFGNFTVITQQH